ncbi:hypothetical protein HPB52_019797 [Rhipicephalus sanguineus]|uniref:Uncharacterized protein n=1 Tax=Rhipicephalus sanguineus TaxID=34632 RepID=A0A9D4Q936_RHISA|nr:hypothetical protein HPB52_019797 [Rhipicephalus sanguineus]
MSQNAPERPEHAGGVSNTSGERPAEERRSSLKHSVGTEGRKSEGGAIDHGASQQIPSAPEKEEVVAPGKNQRFCKPRFMLANMCAITFTHSFLTNGCINVVLPTLERRFQLRSFESAMIISTYNVANCIAIAPIAFMGTSRNKPVFIGVGVLTVGVGALLFSSVHFIAPSYQWGSELQDLCPAGQLPDDLCLSGDVRNYRFLLMLAHALHGIGSTPFYTLGVSYLDENVPTRMVSTYLGKSSVLLNGT